MNCTDCQQEMNIHFWLKDKVWCQIAQAEEVLCLACTQTRLGRDLAKADFSKRHHINYALGHLPIEEAKPKGFKELCFDFRKRFFALHPNLLDLVNL